MSALTPDQLQLLRQRPHSTKLWLSIYKPDTVFTARINDPNIAVGERVITYDNASGLYTDIKAGMTMLVGVTPGGKELGRIRIRSATATTITVAENAHINWQDNAYITVIKFFEIWPIYARFEIQGESVLQYKDYDIEYTNQNELLGTYVNASTHYAGFKNVPVYWDSTGTANMDGVPPGSLSYSWIFEGGHTGSSTAATPGWVNYDTPGHYLTTLQVTSSSGTVDVTYRYVSIYDRPGEGPNVPVLKWEMDSLSGDRDNGGYSVKLRVFESVEGVVDGALVVIFADDTYGDTTQSIGGNAENRGSIVFVGYVIDGSIRYDYRDSYVEFEAASPTEIMKLKEGTNVSVESALSPSGWDEIKDLNIPKALFHFLKWHSTILLSTGFRLLYHGPLSSNSRFQFFETDPATLYDSINSFMQSAVIGKICSDRQGTIWGEIEAGALSNAAAAFPAPMSISRQDWIDEPEITEIQSPPVSYLEMGGVAYSGAATGSSTAYLAAAPGNVPAYFGKAEEQQGLILVSQEHLNALVGNVFAWKNSRYPSIVFRLSGNYRNLDIAPQEITKVIIMPEDTRRGISFINKEFIVQGMSWEYDPAKQIFVPEVDLHEVTAGYDGATIPIPVPPVENIPPYEPPPDDPGFPVLPPPPGLPDPCTDDPPIWIPQPPPTIPDCPVSAPQNSYDAFINMTLYGNQEPSKVTAWVPGTIRTVSHINPTVVEINGCWEKSLDGGTTWEAWTEAEHWGVRAKNCSDPNSGLLDAGISVGVGTCPETRYGVFTPASLYNIRHPGGIEIYLDNVMGQQMGGAGLVAYEQHTPQHEFACPPSIRSFWFNEYTVIEFVATNKSPGCADPWCIDADSADRYGMCWKVSIPSSVTGSGHFRAYVDIISGDPRYVTRWHFQDTTIQKNNNIDIWPGGATYSPCFGTTSFVHSCGDDYNHAIDLSNVAINAGTTYGYVALMASAGGLDWATCDPEQEVICESRAAARILALKRLQWIQGGNTTDIFYQAETRLRINQVLVNNLC